ncbi:MULTISPECIES: cytidine deaminase [unclassified Streptomyces]|uniref:cytidine deaminase n=1 Tax=unclassified Streptomyces TaxID=2593676 RepID=UPI002E1DF8EF|nr:cytidine deaminase [Streptomyces sp. NBC_01023]
MKLDQALVDAAIAQMDRRWPGREDAGAAAVYLDDGRILTSVCFDNLNAGVTLCHEVGAYCQAYTLDRKVTASVCVNRIAGRLVILAPCGICQERLALWGPGVEVAVPAPGAPGGWQARTLAEVNPYYWGREFADGGGWPSAEVHTG